MSFPHIRSPRDSTSLQGLYALQGRSLPSEIFNIYIQTQSFSLNQQYWIQKLSGGPLFKVRIDSIKLLELPEPIASAVLSIDSDRAAFQKLKLYAGNNSTDALAAGAIENDESVNRRFKVIASLS